MVAENQPLKTVCLLGSHLPPFFTDLHPKSEAIEQHAIDLWNAGFGVLTPHLNAPRAEGLVIPKTLQLWFDVAMIRKFADAVFILQGWETDEYLWRLVAAAHAHNKPVFDSLEQINRWREGKRYAYLASVPAAVPSYIDDVPGDQMIKIVFVVGKYFVGTKMPSDAGEKPIWIPNRNAIHDNITAANHVAVMLWRERIAAFTPHNNTHHFELKTRVPESIYQTFDRILLERLIDGLVVLPSWVNSTGAPLEVALAQQLGLPVMHDYDLPSIRNWRDGKGPINVLSKIVLH